MDELLHRAAEAGASGSTVLAAYEGFGRRHSHEPTFWHKVDQTPLVGFFVDTPERIETLLVLVDEVIPDCVAVIEQVQAIRHTRAAAR